MCNASRIFYIYINTGSPKTRPWFCHAESPCLFVSPEPVIFVINMNTNAHERISDFNKIHTFQVEQRHKVCFVSFSTKLLYITLDPMVPWTNTYSRIEPLNYGWFGMPVWLSPGRYAIASFRSTSRASLAFGVTGAINPFEEIKTYFFFYFVSFLILRCHTCIWISSWKT